MHSISSRPQIHVHKELKFPICIRNFSFKFLNYDTPVYTLNTLENKTNMTNKTKDLHTNPIPQTPQKASSTRANQPHHKHHKQYNKHYKDTQYFTAPLFMKDEDRSENVMISLICPRQTELVQKDLLSTFDIETSILNLSLGDLSYHASILRTPLVTIVNSYCEMKGDGGHKKLIWEEKEKEDNKSQNTNTEYEIFYTKKYLEVIEDYESRNTSFL